MQLVSTLAGDFEVVDRMFVLCKRDGGHEQLERHDGWMLSGRVSEGVQLNVNSSETATLPVASQHFCTHVAS